MCTSIPLLDTKECLKMMILEGRSFDLDGQVQHPTGTVSLAEAEYIMDVIREKKLSRCVETGVAYGASTIAVCEALIQLEKMGLVCKHYGVDPCQYSEFNGSAIAVLRRCGLDHLFELLEGPSHIMLPKLLERNVSVDFALVDGWHTFDYTLVDVFLADKLLRSGGILMIHDMQMPSKRMVWRYLRTHRRYRRLRGPIRPLWRRVLSFGRNVLAGRPRQAWGLLITSEVMLVLQKLEDFEPEHHFFRRF